MNEESQNNHELRDLFRSELGAAVARLIERQDAAVAGLVERQDAAVVSIAHDFSDLRAELSRRMESLERRFEVQAPVILSIDARMAALTRAIDQVLGAHDQTAATLAAQQRAMEQLAARVKALEDKATGRQQ